MCTVEGESSHADSNPNSSRLSRNSQGPGFNCLNIMYFNAQSLLLKMDNLSALVDVEKPHIVCIVESWLSSEILDNEVSLEGFHVLRLDRNRHSGGIIIFVHNTLVSKVVVAGPNNLELLIISVSNHVNSYKYHLGLFYRPPSSGVQCMEDLYNSLESLEPSCFSSFVLIGDFNIDCCNHSPFLYSHFCTILNSFSLKQVVDGHTHVSPSGSISCIDLALVSNLSQLKKCEIIPPLTEYNHGHSGLQLSIIWKPTRRSTINASGRRTIWKYAQADFTKASSLIDNTSWDSVLTGDVNESLAKWEAKYMEIMELCIPKSPLPKRRNLPWLTKDIRRAIRRRNVLYRRARREHNSSLFSHYQHQRNKVVRELRRSKAQFFRRFNPSNAKQFWKMNKMLNKNKPSIPALVRNGCTASKNSDKAAMLNNFFSECFNTALPPLSACEDYADPSDFESTDTLLCTEEEVYKMITSLDTSKANGPDGISAKMLKGTASSIAPVLTRLFNQSLESGIFPDMENLLSGPNSQKYRSFKSFELQTHLFFVNR